MDEPIEIYEPYAHEQSVQTLRVFREVFQCNPRVIYYPGCSSDAAPSLAFPESRVIYVDLTEADIRSLKAKGYEAYCINAHEYVPDSSPDVLILLNTGVEPEIASRSMEVGSYVLCNNYFHTADMMHKLSSFHFLGVIHSVGDSVWHDTESLDKFWQEVDTEEELAASDPGGFFTRLVQQQTGKTENVLAEYHKLLERARENAARYNTSPDEPLFLDMRLGIAIQQLPRKKEGGLFIFRRVFRAFTDLSFTPL